MTNERPVLCAGSALWDVIARTERVMRPGHDVPGRISRQMGGVALNVALALARRGRAVELLSTVGRDASGDSLIAAATAAGVGCAYVTRTGDPTDSYMVIEDGSGDVFAAVADCLGLEQSGHHVLMPLRDGPLGTAAQPWTGALVVDGNFPEPLLDGLTDDPALAASHLALVPASPGKARRLVGLMSHPRATFYLNRIEAQILYDTPFDTAAQAAQALITKGATQVVVTDSHRPAAAAKGDQLVTGAPPSVQARTTTGAGDAFLAAHLDATVSGHDPQAALAQALEAATRHITQGRSS